MCGIFGMFKSRDASAKRMLASLNRSRGRHALGVLLVAKGRARWTKRSVDVADILQDMTEASGDDPLVKFRKLFNSNKAEAFLGHTRGASPVIGRINDHECAHPFQVKRADGSFIIGAHNGFVQNFEALKKEYKDEDGVSEMKVDSEILFHMIAHHGIKSLSKMRGKAALWWIDSNNPREVYFWLWKQDFHTGKFEGKVVFSSEAEPLKLLGAIDVSRIKADGPVCHINLDKPVELWQCKTEDDKGETVDFIVKASEPEQKKPKTTSYTNQHQSSRWSSQYSANSKQNKSNYLPSVSMGESHSSSSGKINIPMPHWVAKETPSVDICITRHGVSFVQLQGMMQQDGFCISSFNRLRAAIKSQMGEACKIGNDSITDRSLTMDFMLLTANGMISQSAFEALSSCGSIINSAKSTRQVPMDIQGPHNIGKVVAEPGHTEALMSMFALVPSEFYTLNEDQTELIIGDEGVKLNPDVASQASRPCLREPSLLIQYEKERSLIVKESVRKRGFFAYPMTGMSVNKIKTSVLASKKNTDLLENFVDIYGWGGSGYPIVVDNDYKLLGCDVAGNLLLKDEVTHEYHVYIIGATSHIPNGLSLHEELEEEVKLLASLVKGNAEDLVHTTGSL